MRLSPGRTRAALAVIMLLAGLLVQTGAASAVPGAGSSVFINEIHYDNTGTDAGEAIEIAPPAGTDLTGWQIVRYNGSNGTSYGTDTLSGVVADQSGGFGFITVSYPANGLQNGSPDGVALVDGGGSVVQFLSYEGVFAATDGPAAGQTSTDLGVSEASGTPVGFSLQLTGSGSQADEFTWAAAAADTFGAANTGQTLGGGGGPATPLLINEVDADQAGTDNGEFVELTDGGSGTTALDGLVLVFFNGSSDTSYAAFDLDGQATGADGYWVLCGDAGVVGGCDLDVSPDTNLIQNGADAVALYEGDASDFPNGSAVTTDGLVDAVVYDTNDADDPGLLALLVAGGQLNEGANGNATGEANGRCPDGAGVGRDTTSFVATTPTPGAANDCDGGGGPTEPTLIHDIQGSGPTVAISGPVQVEGIVTSLFEDNDALDGFFIQEEDSDADADPSTSEGIFVFCRGACPPTLAVGDLVTILGNATDFFGMSQIDASASVGGSTVITSSGNTLPAASPLALPAAGRTDAEATFEAVEGMLVRFDDTLAVSEYFQLARYGQVVLTDDARPEQFTDANSPSVAGYAAFLDDLASRRIILDDNNNDQNDRTTAPLDNEPYAYPVGGLSTTNVFRGGETIAGLTGVLHWSFAGQSGTDAWRVRPVDGEDYSFTATNPRPVAPPVVGGDLSVASFNVLNYFTTLDEPGATCGPSALGCRGAHSAAELQRQRDKIVAAIAAMDADIVGIIEVENDAGGSLADLVNGLNAEVGAGTYDYVDTGAIGGDAIKVGFIYQPASVSTVGAFAILDSSVDPTFIDDKNRPALIQTFEDGDGERLTVAVNHFKSKGSACDDVGDPNANDGQGNCNGTRTAAAAALASYLATDPTGSGDADVLIIGDLNAYAMEDPITTLESAGYTDLVEQFVGPSAYTFVFDGQLGYLDHALANGALVPQVTGLATWNINADEVNLLDYNDDIQDPNEASFERESSATDLFDPDPFRSSDHDPVLIGLRLSTALECGDVSGSVEEIESQGYNVIVGTEGPDVLVGTNGRDFIVRFAATRRRSTSTLGAGCRIRRAATRSRA